MSRYDGDYPGSNDLTVDVLGTYGAAMLKNIGREGWGLTEQPKRADIRECLQLLKTRCAWGNDITYWTAWFSSDVVPLMEKAERLRKGGASFSIEPRQVVVVGYENETRVLFSDQYYLVPHYVGKANGSSNFWGFLDERHTEVFSAPSDYTWPATPLNVGWSASHFPNARLSWRQFKVTPGFKAEAARAAIERARAAIEEVCSFSPPAINL